MSDLSIDYVRCLKKFGEPVRGTRLSENSLLIYKNKLPSTFLAFEENYGLGKWLQAYFQLAEPTQFKSVINIIFEGDKQILPEKTHAIGFSAFGKILAWNQSYGAVQIDTLYQRVTCSDLFKPKPNVDEDINLGVVMANVDSPSYDPPDQDGKPMFKRALKMHGELEFGQIYAPKLHPALGGAITVENLRPADALVAMTIAAQAGAFTLYDTTKPNVPAVRHIGE
ncbi:GAD-like domain-containing protein [Neorhizobium alkalisoli]|uniref:Uncharacterized protein n=1 Tax=Neorhizobium alkalisoli TaxID=528178 RepID=A0A561QI85_9HYPH|nr:GAD-like domain-containing protein [Neorhizobium alkalisoli]TWF50080.1 hypothetical protein FHW37_10637 [Neorhizobium alkalisoli]